MPDTITSFLVGLGFEFDKKGVKEVDSAIDSVKSKALQLGAVVAGAFGIKKLTLDFAQGTDTLSKFSKTIGVSANDVAALGRTLENEGGSFQSALSQLESIERLRAGLLTGDAGFLEQADIAGLDSTKIVEATDSFEAFLTLADQFQNLSQQQRLNAASALGFDLATIRLLSKGREEVMRLIQAQRDIRPVTDAATESAAEFNKQMSDMFNNIGRVADQISERLLPQINNVTKGINEWFDVNRGDIGTVVNDTIDFIEANVPEASAAGLLGASGALRAGALASLPVPLVGPAVSGTLAALSTAALIGSGIAAVISLTDEDSESFKEKTGLELPEWFFKPVGELIQEIPESADIPDILRGVPIPVPGMGTLSPFVDAGSSLVDVLSALNSPAISPLAQQSSLQGSSPLNARGARNVSGPETITVNLSLDGSIIDQHIVRVVSEEAQTTIDDLQSPVGG